jgi:hypothetical protein
MAGSERSQILRYYSRICLDRLGKTTKVLIQDSRSPGRHLKPKPPEHEAGVLTTEPQPSFLRL